MRIAIAGVTQTLGRYLTAELGSRGHEVRVLSRSAPRVPRGPGHRGEGLEPALRGFAPDIPADWLSGVCDWSGPSPGELAAHRPARLWIMGGSLQQCRPYSRYLALQIRGAQEGLAPSATQRPAAGRPGE